MPAWFRRKKDKHRRRTFPLLPVEIEKSISNYYYCNCIYLKMSIINRATRNVLRRGCIALFGAAMLLPFAAVTPKAEAQISINIGGPPPVCPYGYYDYAPYRCAPVGFYGPGYFYNGIFLGVGPWAHWGYRHGWGSHRFVGSRGGRYYPGHRYNERRYVDRPHGYARGHERREYRGGHEAYRGAHGGGHGGGHGEHGHGGGGHR
jgi:hypothetical protein